MRDSLGRTEEAHATIASAHEAHPEFIPAINDLGRYELWVRGRPDRALAWFMEAYRKTPNFVDAQVPIAFYPLLVYALSDHWPQAEQWLEREMATAPEANAVVASQLLFAGMRGDREKASAVLQQFLANPQDRLLRGLYAGDAALLIGDWKNAAGCYRAIQAESRDVRSSARWRRLQMKLGFALRMLGEDAESSRLLQEASIGLERAPRFALLNWTINPNNAVQYLDAEIFALRGETEKSLDALDAMLALPDDGFIPIGALPVPIEDSPLLESLRAAPRFADFKKEVSRRRKLMHERVAASAAFGE